ncbi:MAG: hypothetical protein PUD92_04365 [Clostridiales bacterium]|nr:hypothetical protein [Clostridiales bacterium]
MYTEKSVELKSDFYTRFGETTGELCFERVGVPCVIMDSGSHALAFALGCGVRAYGRRYGDVLRILNAGSNVCDVHFMKSGRGAQILYSTDVPGLPGMKDTAVFAIEKLLVRMSIAEGHSMAGSAAAICDRYGSGGWCAYASYDEIKEIPLPLTGYNVLLIRTRRKKNKKIPRDVIEQYCAGEKERIIAAADGLKKCRINVLFDMINESERAYEYLMNPPEQAAAAVKAAMSADGVKAAKICDNGVICFTVKDKTDSIIHAVSEEYEKKTGFSAEVLVVK